MPADRDRISFDKSQLYRGVVTQQGRVTLAADTNEAQEIQLEENREQLVDIVGKAGTPDDGYLLSFPGGTEILVGPGTMYVGGLRAFLPLPTAYSAQPDWLTAPPIAPGRAREYVFLQLEEREISAVEDSALREVALGGPDTAQRLRLWQRIMREVTTASNCADALTIQRAAWQAAGWTLNTGTMKLESTARLRVQFPQVVPAPTQCEPAAAGGFLGAENQLIRIRLTSPTTFVWGYDNASYLYRADVVDSTTVKLATAPPDTFHYPRAGKVVELLRSEARLANAELVAAAEGALFTLTADYNPDTQSVPLPAAIDPSFIPPGGTPRMFVRVWEQQVTFTPGTAVALGSTGLEVIITAAAGIHTGDFWTFAVRPGVPADQQIFPPRYRLSAQPPEGPRRWVCPLGIVNWQATGGGGTLLADCREKFEDLVTLTKRRSGGGCCTITLTPPQLAGTTLDAIIAAQPAQVPLKICLSPGTYTLRQPVRIGRPDVTIEGCPGGVVFNVASVGNRDFRFGLFTLRQGAGVTFRGLRFDLTEAALGERPLLGLKIADLNKLEMLNAEALSVAIGIGTMDCDELVVENCEFRFPQPQARSHLGAAILGAGSTSRLAISGCTFLEPTRKQSLIISQTDFFCRTALLYTHTMFGDPVTLPGTVPINGYQGEVSPATIQAFEFIGNHCIGLSAAFFVQATAGDVRINGNNAIQSYSGTWLLSAYALTTLDQTLNIDYKIVGSWLNVNFFLNDLALRLLSCLGRGLERETPALRRLPFAGTAVPPSLFPPQVSTDLLKRLDRTFWALNATEPRAFAAEGGGAAAVHYDFNDIDSRITVNLSPNFIASGPACVIWCDDFRRQVLTVDTGTVTMSSNQLQCANTFGPATVVILAQQIAITGNTIMNEAGNDIKTSLVCSPSRPPNEQNRIAITGNVLRGNMRAPARQFAAPLNIWEALNTVLGI